MEPSMDWWFESKKYWSLGIVAEKKQVIIHATINR
jgi:hypothetical protein